MIILDPRDTDYHGAEKGKGRERERERVCVCVRVCEEAVEKGC